MSKIIQIELIQPITVCIQFFFYHFGGQRHDAIVHPRDTKYTSNINIYNTCMHVK